jgi:hypothetical protein
LDELLAESAELELLDGVGSDVAIDDCSDDAAIDEELSTIGLLLVLLGWGSESAGAPPHAESMAVINKGKVHELSFSTHLYIFNTCVVINLYGANRGCKLR